MELCKHACCVVWYVAFMLNRALSTTVLLTKQGTTNLYKATRHDIINNSYRQTFLLNFKFKFKLFIKAYKKKTTINLFLTFVPALVNTVWIYILFKFNSQKYVSNAKTILMKEAFNPFIINAKFFVLKTRHLLI